MEKQKVIIIGGARSGKTEAMRKAKEMLQNKNVEFIDYGCPSNISCNHNEYSCNNDLENYECYPHRNVGNYISEFVQTMKYLDDNSKPTKNRNGSDNGSFVNKVSKRRSKNKSARKSKQRNRK